jgi:NTP pyrophosphatase (non-canonical NTP hydrolase)
MTSSIEADGEHTIGRLTRVAQEFADARQWHQFHDPKNLTMALASEVGELVSILRWVRSEDSDAAVASGPRRDALRAEIGDVGICLMLLCARARINLGDAIIDKVRANADKYPVSDSVGQADPPRKA